MLSGSPPQPNVYVGVKSVGGLLQALLQVEHMLLRQLHASSTMNPPVQHVAFNSSFSASMSSWVNQN